MIKEEIDIAPFGLDAESKEEFWEWVFPTGTSLITPSPRNLRYVSSTPKGITKLAQKFFGLTTETNGLLVDSGWANRVCWPECFREGRCVSVKGVMIVGDNGEEIKEVLR